METVGRGEAPRNEAVRYQSSIQAVREFDERSDRSMFLKFWIILRNNQQDAEPAPESGFLSLLLHLQPGLPPFIDLGYPVRMEADRLTGMAAYNKLNIHMVEPFLSADGNFASIIESTGARKQKAV